jgi:hypothetical protein
MSVARVRRADPASPGEGPVNKKINTKHLRQVGLTVFETKLLGLLMKSGGEYPMPSTPEARARLEITRGKGLVEVVQRFGERQFVRLTDEGRVVCAQLEAMTVQPKLEVVN